MNGNDPNREQMEIRLVALLLGEASDFEQAELRAAMEKDASLNAFFNEMKATLGLVQEASKKFIETPASAAAPKLSPERREKLLASFKVIKLKEPARTWSMKRLVVGLGIAAGLAVLSTLFIPNFVVARSGKATAQHVQLSQLSLPPKPAPAPVAATLSPAPMVAMREIKRESTPEVLARKRASDMANKETADRYSEARDDLSQAAANSPKSGIFLPPQASQPNVSDELASEARKQQVSVVSLENGDPLDVQNLLQDKFENSGTIKSSSSLQTRPLSTRSTSMQQQQITTTAPPTATPPQVMDGGTSVGGGMGGGGGMARIRGMGSLMNGTPQNIGEDRISGSTQIPASAGGNETPPGNARHIAKELPKRPPAEPAAVALDLSSVNPATQLPTAAAPMAIFSLSGTAAEANRAPQLSEGLSAGSKLQLAQAESLTSPAPTASPAPVDKPLVIAKDQVTADISTDGNVNRPVEKSLPGLVQPAAPPAVISADLVMTKPVRKREKELRQIASEEKESLQDSGKLAWPNSGHIEDARALIENQTTSGAVAPAVPAPQAQSAPSGSESLARNYYRAKNAALSLDKEAKQKVVVTDLGIESNAQGEVGDLADQKAAKVEQSKIPQVIASPELPKDAPLKKSPGPIPTPQPEISTAENAFSTFSLNVSDVTFKLAEASLQNNALPDPASIRVEEFVNAFNYHDPAPLPGARLAFAWERARYPFAHNRDILRLGIQTAARGREAQKPLNLVILLDNSGSMERPDRVAIMREALKVLANQLRPQDRISVIAFARTARLWIDGMAGGNAAEFLAKVLDLNPDGGTNLEDAMNLGYETAAKHFMANGVNHVILLTDGAANLGNVEPEELKKKVVSNRQKGIALDCYGIGWEGYDDDLLEVLSRNGDGRYGFLNQPEQAGPEFADQLAGALNVAAADVKTQVEFNPARVTSWRQIGYAKHQLTKEQFRDNTVDAAEIAAAEQGNALYVIEVDPRGSGPLGTVRVRFKVPDTGEYIENSWPMEYQSQAPALENATPAMRLAVTASAFGEWLSQSPSAADVTPAALQSYLTGLSATFAPDPRPARLETMIRQARAIAGK